MWLVLPSFDSSELVLDLANILVQKTKISLKIPFFDLHPCCPSSSILNLIQLVLNLVKSITKGPQIKAYIISGHLELEEP